MSGHVLLLVLYKNQKVRPNVPFVYIAALIKSILRFQFLL